MAITKAMRDRHTVRKYINKPLPPDVVKQLEQRILRLNAEHGTSLKLMVEDTSAFNFITRLVLAKGVRNYVILAGFAEPGLAERLGWAGSDLMLFAQELGLNTWWATGTFNHLTTSRAVPGKRVLGVIALGYGATQGKPHKSRPSRTVSSYAGTAPAWFEEGVEAALLAPTAVNQQAFFIRGEGNRVSVTYKGGPNSGMDLGIIKHHFAVGAGEENFVWA